jgi:vacuolar-type H+-ATPase subunit E/Vma4
LALPELLNTLRKNEQKQIEDIWQAAKNEAETIRRQIDDAIADITKKNADRLAAASRSSMRLILSAAATKTREKKLSAYQAIDRALQKAAAKQLPLLREKSYDAVFARLVAELPEREWEKIVVNPADLALAANFFAADIIRSDPAISGGLIAAAAADKIIVDNTFEKRLERKWFQLLPALIAEIDKRYGKSGTAENIA